MAKYCTDVAPDLPDASGDIRELREAAFELGKALRTFGKSRLAAMGEEVSEEAQVVVMGSVLVPSGAGIVRTKGAMTRRIPTISVIQS